MTRSTQHISIADFKASFPRSYANWLESCEEFGTTPEWVNEIVAFDVVFDKDDHVVEVFAFDQEDEDESKRHEYRADCPCADCQEMRLGVVLEEEE